MDFWSRLIGGSGPRTSRAKSTTERLSAFKKICNSLDQIYRKASHVSPPTTAAPGSHPPIITFHFDLSLLHHIRTSLQRLNDLLSDESKGPSPHPCHTQAISPYRIHATATRLAIQTHDAGIIAETATLFNVLIENETEIELVGTPAGESRRGSQAEGEGDGDGGQGEVQEEGLGRGEQGSVIYDADFAKTLIDLVSKGATICGEENEVRLVELLFCVANMIRSRPGVLKTWFHPNRTKGLLEREASETTSEADDEDEEYDQILNKGVDRQFAGATRKNDFPLFYLLINYVHHAGRPGDFARTAVLYIIETASHSKILERWLVESDLSTLMATGLGALYSQLNRKLPFASSEALRQQQKNDNKVSERQLAILDKINPDDDLLSTCLHAQDSGLSSVALGKDMNAFLSYLFFWQDTIEHCRSAEVNETLLEHFQVLFLQQLLYPSLLESSDVDGGSTSTVLTYLTRILESLDQPDLVHRILHFLLASPVVEFEKARVEATQSQTKHTESPQSGNRPAKFRRSPQHDKKLSISRRMSIARLTPFISPAPSEVPTPVTPDQTESPKPANDPSLASSPSPALFNLVDIAIMGLRSKNTATVTATLRLISVIVNNHHVFSGDLIKTLPSDQMHNNKNPAGNQRSIGALNAEISQFIALAEVIIRGPGLDNVYEKYLIDAKAALGVHRMESFVDYHNTPGFLQALSVTETSETHQHSSKTTSQRLFRPRTIDPSDPLLSGIAHLLTSFFTNSITLNLSLTSAIKSLVSSNLLSLDGWLLVEPQNYKFPQTKSSTRENDNYGDHNHDSDDDNDDIDNEDNDQLLESSIFDDAIERKVKRTIRQLKHAYIQPRWSRKHVPLITVVIRALVKQVDKWRVEIPEWDALMVKRKSVLMDPKPPDQGDKEAKRRRSRVGSKGERRLRTPSYTSSSTPASEARSATPPLDATPPLTPSSSSRPHSPQGKKAASSSSRNVPLNTAEGRVISSSSSSMSTTNETGITSSNGSVTNANGLAVDKLRNFPSSSLRLRTASGTSVRSKTSAKTVSASEEELNALREEQKKEELKRMMTMMFPVGRVRTSRKTDENTPSPENDNLEVEREPEVDHNNNNDKETPVNDKQPDPPGKTANHQSKAATSSSSDASKDEDDDETQLVPLSHLLTNATLLHEFILELSALTQARAMLFQEVGFS